MPVKYLPKAEGGAAVGLLGGLGTPQAPGGGTDQSGLDDALKLAQAEQALAEQRAQQEFMLGLLNTLGGLSRGAQGEPPSYSVVVPPVDAILGEQRARAAMLAESLHPDAQYLPFMNPGGLFDSLAFWMANRFGVNPTLEPAARLANRVPMDTLGSSFDDALALATRVAQAAQLVQTSPGVPATGGGYDDLIGQMVSALVGQALGQGAGSAQAQKETSEAKTTRPKITPPSFAGSAGVRDPAEAQRLAQEQVRAALAGGGLTPTNIFNTVTAPMTTVPTLAAPALQSAAEKIATTAPQMMTSPSYAAEIMQQAYRQSHVTDVASFLAKLAELAGSAVAGTVNKARSLPTDLQRMQRGLAP